MEIDLLWSLLQVVANGMLVLQVVLEGMETCTAKGIFPSGASQGHATSCEVCYEMRFNNDHK